MPGPAASTGREDAMRRHRLVRLSPLAFALVGLFGPLGASPVVAASGAYSLVTFDDRIKSVPPGDGDPARVSNQYRDDLGIEFHEDAVYAFGAAGDGGLARSGPNALACFDGIDRCPTAVGWGFDAPQGWIEAWVGFGVAHPGVEIPIMIIGFDARDQRVAESRTTIPASDNPSPVSVPVWAATNGDPTIVRVEITRPGAGIGGVIVDDVAFAKGTPPPDLALLGPSATLNNGSIAVAGLITNVGPVPVPAFTATIDGPSGVTSVPIGGLDPGQSSPLAATVDLPVGFSEPFAHIGVVVGGDLPVADENPSDNMFNQDVLLPVPASSPVSTEPPAAPPTIAPSTPAPAQPGSPAQSTNLFPILLVVAAVAGIGVAAKVLWPRPRPLAVPQSAALHGEATTENGVKVTIDVDGEQATATVEFDDVTVTVDGSGPSSIKVQDGPPPKSCQPLRFGNLADRRCWYAQRQVTVARADGRVRGLTIVVERGPEVGATEPVPDALTQRILQLDTAKDRQAATAAALRDLTELASNVVGSMDGASRLIVLGRVAWLKVPAQITLHACLGTGAEGAFKKLSPIQHTWDVMHNRKLAAGPVRAGEEPGDSIRDVIAAAIDQAGRPQPLL